MSTFTAGIAIALAMIVSPWLALFIAFGAWVLRGEA
jgi:hypothetical protein